MIPQFTQLEQWTLRSCLDQRWGKDAVNFEVVEVEARLDPADHRLTGCPAFFWMHDDCHYVIIKTGDQSYRCEFYYRDLEQYGAGINEFSDLGDCAVELLRLQEDYESVRSNALPGTLH